MEKFGVLPKVDNLRDFTEKCLLSIHLVKKKTYKNFLLQKRSKPAQSQRGECVPRTCAKECVAEP